MMTSNMEENQSLISIILKGNENEKLIKIWLSQHKFNALLFCLHNTVVPD